MRSIKLIFIIVVLLIPICGWSVCVPISGSCLNCEVIYTCKIGYYGTATGVNTGCTACPSNATCPGGTNPSTFTCNSGHYKSSSTTCSPCPPNATCTTGSVVCNAGYYYNGSSCVNCKSATGNSNATSNSGSTSITGCYLSAGKTGSNTKGSYIIDTGTCNYAQ